jgi:hypothetical protein
VAVGAEPAGHAEVLDGISYLDLSLSGCTEIGLRKDNGAEV